MSDSDSYTVACYRETTRQNPGLVKPRLDLCTVFQRLRKFKLAIAACRSAQAMPALGKVGLGVFRMRVSAHEATEAAPSGQGGRSVASRSRPVMLGWPDRVKKIWHHEAAISRFREGDGLGDYFAASIGSLAVRIFPRVDAHSGRVVQQTLCGNLDEGIQLPLQFVLLRIAFQLFSARIRPKLILICLQRL